jgi:hypothetical protein
LYYVFRLMFLCCLFNLAICFCAIALAMVNELKWTELLFVPLHMN